MTVDAGVMTLWVYAGLLLIAEFASLSIIPLIRILSLCIPLMHFEYILWFLIVGVPLFAAIFTCMYIQHLDLRSVGLKIPSRKDIPLTGGLILLGMPVLYRLSRGTPLSRAPAAHIYRGGWYTRDLDSLYALWLPPSWKLVARLRACRGDRIYICTRRKKDRIDLWRIDIARGYQCHALPGHAVSRASSSGISVPDTITCEPVMFHGPISSRKPHLLRLNSLKIESQFCPEAKLFGNIIFMRKADKFKKTKNRSIRGGG